VAKFKEPTMLLTVTEVLELVEVFQNYAEDNKHLYTDKEFEEIKNRYNYYHQRAATKLVAYNRKTIQDA